ncbi:hypothetical protein FBU30_008308 [Linnemannia zychae]|nr:hypothetical protein FBU30_008308 [Linnemannia zychae]
MSTNHKDTHSLHSNDIHINNRSHMNPSFSAEDMEPDQSCCSRLFILSAIVVFISVGISSVPNILSAHNPSQLHKDNSLATSSPPSAHQHQPAGGQVFTQHRTSDNNNDNDNSNNKIQDLYDITGNAIAESWIQMIVGSPTKDMTQQDVPTPAVNGQGSPSVNHPPVAPASSSSSSFPYQGSSQEPLRQYQPKGAPSKQHDSTIWPIVKTSAWFIYRVSLWSIRTSYWAVRSVVAKPLAVVAALVETPYTMMKDICLAFLPVYSFFSVAAAIGIVVGGLALWIAQLLISAIGADQEATSSTITTTTTSIEYSQSKPLGYRKPQHLSRSFNQGRQRHDPLLGPISIDTPSEVPSIREDATQSRGSGLTRRTHIPSSVSMQPTQERGPRRRREILTDDDGDDDDDDDDDDDHDWRGV